MKENKEINPCYNIPFYIFEEIVEYIEKTAHGKCETIKWENIKKLLRCAVLNNCLTEQQADDIERIYCREK